MQMTRVEQVESIIFHLQRAASARGDREEMTKLKRRHDKRIIQKRTVISGMEIKWKYGEYCLCLHAFSRNITQVDNELQPSYGFETRTAQYIW